MFGVTGPFETYADTYDRLQLAMALGLDDDFSGGAGASAFAFRPLMVADKSEVGTNGSIQKHLNDNRHLLDMEFRSPHDVDVSPDGSALFVAELKAPYLWKINIVESGKPLLKKQKYDSQISPKISVVHIKGTSRIHTHRTSCA